MHLIEIFHRTTYTFDQIVGLRPHRLLLRPRDGFDLRIKTSALQIEPKANIHWARDSLGNDNAIATFREETKVLDILSKVTVEQYQNQTLSLATLPQGDQGFEPDLEVATDLPRAFKAVAAPLKDTPPWSNCAIMPSRSAAAFSCLADFCETLHQHIDYAPRNNPGVQSPFETIQLEAGCCRDIAWLFIQATRQSGFASRFVSGYLVNHQPKVTGTKNQGATHAWAEVYLPAFGWLGFDPTLGRPVGPKHVAVAVAAQPDSICPVSGAFVGPKNTTSTLMVDVQCARQDHPITETSGAVIG